MKIKRKLFPIIVVVALGYGAFFLYGYVAAYVVPISITLTTRFGPSALLLPGIVSAVVVRLSLAVITRLAVPEEAVSVAFLAVTPVAGLLLWVSATYGSRRIWWIELSDVFFLAFSTYSFVSIAGKSALGHQSGKKKTCA